MAAPTPHNWRTAIVNMAVSALFVAVALHIAASLIRTVLPELIGGLVVAALAYSMWAFARFRRDRW